MLIFARRLLLLSQGRIDEGVEQFREVLRFNPGYAKAYFNLGKVFAQRERLDGCTGFQHAMRLQPGVAEIHENLAQVFARQGKKNEAGREYEKALRLMESRCTRMVPVSCDRVFYNSWVHGFPW